MMGTVDFGGVLINISEDEELQNEAIIVVLRRRNPNTTSILIGPLIKDFLYVRLDTKEDCCG